MIMIIKMVKEIRRRVDEHSGILTKRKYKELTKLKNTKTEIKNTLEGINSTLHDTEEWIRELENRVVEINDFI